jgi:hypothetical protein
VRVNLPSDVDVQAGSMDLPCGDEEPLDCASNVSSDVDFGTKSGGPDQWVGNGWARNGMRGDRWRESRGGEGWGNVVGGKGCWVEKARGIAWVEKVG